MGEYWARLAGIAIGADRIRWQGHTLLAGSSIPPAHLRWRPRSQKIAQLALAQEYLFGGFTAQGRALRVHQGQHQASVH